MSDEALVRMAGLFARDDRGAIHGLNLALPAGASGALLGSPGDGTSALVQVLSGSERPRSGDVTVAGARPFFSPSVRSRIGALPDTAALPDMGRVRDLLVVARMLRGSEAPRGEWYEPLHMQDLDDVPVARLDLHQRRTVALALALAVPSPLLIVLHEPLCQVLHVDRSWLRTLLARRSAQGACVLVLTSSVHDASSLVDDVATLQRGRIGRAIGAPDVEELTPGMEVELHVWSDAPRALASALVLEPAVCAVAWDTQAGSPVRVRCTKLEEGAATVARVAVSNGARIEALQPVLPGLSEVNAASAGLALTARHEAAYRAASRPAGQDRS
jgi:ABC-2 type transport system ATP-binding protein